MAENLHRSPLAFGSRPATDLASVENLVGVARPTTQESADKNQPRSWRILLNRLSRMLVSLASTLTGGLGARIKDDTTTGGDRMIFRRENRGESFQRQISNLRQQSDAPPEDEEREFEYEQDETADTSRFSTEQGTPGEGISFPASRVEAEEQEVAEAAPAQPAATSVPSYSQTTQWQPAVDTSASIIAANTSWNGTLKSEGSLRVHGRADGELHSATDLFVAEGAEVDASLFADSVVVAGLVRGKIEARSRLEILPQGEVTGDVRSPKLVVHEGATISGQLKMENVQSQPTYSKESSPGSETSGS